MPPMFFFFWGGVGVPGRCKVDAKMYGNEVWGFGNMMPPGIGWGIPGMTLTDVFWTWK